MQTVYSSRFIIARLAGTGSFVDYTVPTGYKAILRDVDIANPNAGAITVGLLFPGLAFIYYVVVPGSSSAPPWRGRQVFNAGESIRIQSLAGAADVMASGYLLTLP